jgi:Dolichyl-phosphate-mannose-protein mannosyltransferase
MRRFLQAHWPAVLAAFLVLGAKAAFILMTPLRSYTMSPTVIDDTYIVMRVARNIALGHGFSFDGTNPTTGVSMLWTYLTSLHHLIFAKETAAKATFLLSTLFGTFSALATYAIAMRVTASKAASWIALILALLMPAGFFNAMNGMETSFFTFCILMSAGALLGVGVRNGASALRKGLIVGLWAGLAIMTRGDALMFIAALVSMYAWRVLRDPIDRRSALREGIGAGIAIAVLFAVFLAWQFWLVGSPFPDNQVGRRLIAVEKQGFDFAQFALVPYVRVVVWNVSQALSLWDLGIGSALLGLVAWLYALISEKTCTLAILTGIYLTLFLAALVLYQWYFPDYHGLRYFNPGIHLLFIFIGYTLVSLGFTRWNSLPAAVVVLGLMIVTWYRFADDARHHESLKAMSLFGQRDAAVQGQFWAAIDWAKATLPPGTRVAVRDHGRFAFFTDLPVQDLAGILDTQVVTERKNGTLGAYLKARGTQYAVLPDSNPLLKTIYQDIHAQLKPVLWKDAPPQEITGYRFYRLP